MGNIDCQTHAECFGQLFSDLLSLELMLRLCLLRKSSQESSMKNLEKLKKGDPVDENAVTNYDSLGDIIGKFNLAFDKTYWIDETRVVDLRNALAHGRIISTKPYPMRIYKFNKPVEGKVKVLIAEEMTLDWFRKNIKFISNEIDRIKKIYEGLKKS